MQHGVLEAHREAVAWRVGGEARSLNSNSRSTCGPARCTAVRIISIIPCLPARHFSAASQPHSLSCYRWPSLPIKKPTRHHGAEDAPRQLLAVVARHFILLADEDAVRLRPAALGGKAAREGGGARRRGRGIESGRWEASVGAQSKQPHPQSRDVRGLGGQGCFTGAGNCWRKAGGEERRRMRRWRLRREGPDRDSRRYARGGPPAPQDPFTSHRKFTSPTTRPPAPTGTAPGGCLASSWACGACPRRRAGRAGCRGAWAGLRAGKGSVRLASLHKQEIQGDATVHGRGWQTGEVKRGKKEEDTGVIQATRRWKRGPYSHARTHSS